MSGRQGGFTLVEVMIASVVTAVTVAGTMAATLAAARMMGPTANASHAEASALAQQTAERFRNLIACDQPWFDPFTCAVIPANLPGWTEDPLPAGGGSESLTSVDPGAKRCYRLTPADCAGTGDCLAVEVRVCWKGSPCPC